MKISTVGSMLAGLVAAIAAHAAQADILAIPGQPTQIVTGRHLPVRGMSQARVASLFGEPKLKHAAVGNPPIGRWDYPGFSVYFERQFVIHTVVAATQPDTTD